MARCWGMTRPTKSSQVELHVQVRADRVVVLRVEGNDSHAFASLSIDGRLPHTLRGLLDAVEPAQVVVEVEDADVKTDALVCQVRMACRTRRLSCTITERASTETRPPV